MTLKALAWLVPFLLPIAGCILMSTAAYLVAPALGLLVAGASMFFMEWRADAEKGQE